MNHVKYEAQPGEEPHFLDEIDYFVITEYESASMKFRAYKIVAWGENDEACFQHFDDRGCSYSDPKLPEPDISGFIKWDGCGHWDFGEGGYLHLCGMKAVQEFQAVVAWIGEAARDIDGWDGE